MKYHVVYCYWNGEQDRVIGDRPQANLVVEKMVVVGAWVDIRGLQEDQVDSMMDNLYKMSVSRKIRVSYLWREGVLRVTRIPNHYT